MQNVLTLAQAAQGLFEGVNTPDTAAQDPTRSPLNQMQMAQHQQRQQQQAQQQQQQQQQQQLQQQQQQQQQQQPRPQQRQMSLGQMTPLQQQQFLKMGGANMYNGAPNPMNQINMMRQPHQPQNYMKQQNYLQNMGMTMAPGKKAICLITFFVHDIVHFISNINFYRIW